MSFSHSIVSTSRVSAHLLQYCIRRISFVAFRHGVDLNGLGWTKFLLYAKRHTTPKCSGESGTPHCRGPIWIREFNSSDAERPPMLLLPKASWCRAYAIWYTVGLRDALAKVPRRVRVSLRVSRPLFEHLVGVSRETVTSCAGLSQMFIILGFVETSLELEKTESTKGFLQDVQTHQKVESVGPHNPYAHVLRNLSEQTTALPISRSPVLRHFGGSRMILVRLSSRLLVKIDRHARLVGVTRTALLTHFLQRGLLLYLRSQVALAKAHNEALRMLNGPDSSESSR